MPNRTARRQKQWARIPGFVTSFSADGTQAPAGFATAAGSQPTVMRMLGEYTIVADTAPVVAESAFLTVGIAVVSTDAFALGSTAMPDPAIELEFLWLYWAEHGFIRSMRKLRARETLAVILQYAVTNGTPDIRMLMSSTRILLALS